MHYDRLVRQVAAMRGAPDVLSLDDLRAAMRRWDKDGDPTTLTRDELWDVLGQVSNEFTGQRLVRDGAFGYAERANRPGEPRDRLNVEELYRALEAQRSRLASWGVRLQREEPRAAGPRAPSPGAGVSLRGR